MTMQQPPQKGLPEELPPQNIEAEQSALGALMIDKNSIIKVADFLQPKDFYRKSHRLIYDAIMDLFSKTEPIDFLSVSNRLREKKQLEEIGGISYLTTIANIVPTAAHLENYAKIVQRKRILRDLIAASHDLALLGYSEEEDIDTLLEQAEQRIFNVSQHSFTQSFRHIKDSLGDAFERIEQLSKHEGNLRGLRTGFAKLDNILAGLQKSDLIIVAARPSLGKSALALDIARNISVYERVPVGIFSLEMSQDQVVDRLLASQGNVDLWKIRTGHLSAEGEDNDYTRIQEALGALSETPMFIDHSPSVGMLQIRSMSRRLQAEHGLGLLIVDYLQLIQPRNPNDSEVQQITEISRSLKALARELNIPVIAISQLSRAVEQRSPQIPRLSDLRQSGCLTGDTLITDAKTGERSRIDELAKRNTQTPISVAAINDDYTISSHTMIKVFSSGRKKVFEIRTRSGRTIKASANHPFLQLEGWTPLGKLKVGDMIAISRAVSVANPPNPMSVDIIPKTAWELIIEPARVEAGVNMDELGHQYEKFGKSIFRNGIGRMRMMRFAQALPASPILHQLAASDIFWDEIQSITPLGESEVYDATVEKSHNFIANDFIVHNSIEQDGDVVLFIYREDRDRKDTPRKNIADVIVAKHRNGPLGKAELYFDEQRVTYRNIDTRHAETI